MPDFNKKENTKWTFLKACLNLVAAKTEKTVDSSKMETNTTTMIMTTIMLIINIRPTHTLKTRRIIRLIYREVFAATVPRKLFRVPNFAIDVGQLSRWY
jgi:hypothetical protein